MSSGRLGWIIAAVGLAAFAACGKKEDAKTISMERKSEAASKPEEPAPEEDVGESSGTRMASEEGKMGQKDANRARGQFAAVTGAAPGSPPPAATAVDGEPANEAPVHTRAWFPETFLFAPLVVTDASGAAALTVRVPDRLTTWRILALAHSRAGAQAGTTAEFLGTLPVYVDPVVPPYMMVGDDVELPIQVVNTTDTAFTGALRVSAEGVTLGAAPSTVTVPANGARVERVHLRATVAGEARLFVSLGGADAVVRTFDVRPTGKPVRDTRSGTLGAPRTLAITGAAGADPITDRVRLVIFPGALALLRAELAGATGRGGVGEDAYSLLLAGRAPGLLQQLGDTPDREALRTLAIVAGQRAIRHARTLDVPRAALLAEAALAHPDNPVLARLAERAADHLAQHQRPDGTFEGANGWTVQRLLVTTSDATRAVRAGKESVAGERRATAVSVRASGAFERLQGQVDDAYTAAAILASGAATPAVRAALRPQILAALDTRPDGSKVVKVAEGVVRGDGATPSALEATALAILALDGDADAKAPLADMGAALLGAYVPGYGWGDGRANLLCLQAVLRIFRDPPPASVRITLLMDGKVLTEGPIDATKVKDAVTFAAAAPGLAGAHSFELRAEPNVPGLGFSLTLESWVPWAAEEPRAGLELALTVPAKLRVGAPADIGVQAVAPGGVPLRLQHALPAGVVPDDASLKALVTAGTISSYETSDGLVELVIPGIEAGKVFTATYRVIPTLAGTLHASASSLRADGLGIQINFPPATWTVK